MPLPVGGYVQELQSNVVVRYVVIRYYLDSLLVGYFFPRSHSSDSCCCHTIFARSHANNAIVLQMSVRIYPSKEPDSVVLHQARKRPIDNISFASSSMLI